MWRRRREPRPVDDHAVYGVVLTAIATGRPSALTGALSETHAGRGRRLFLLHTRMPGALPGLDQALRYLDELASYPDLPDACRGLLKRSGTDLVTAVESILAGAHNQVMDTSRDLMEIQYLLHEFAAAPERVNEWSSLSERRRAQLFGFGELQKREDARRGVPQGQVGPERLEYQAHCAGLHPSPAGRLDPPIDDEFLIMLADLQEVTEHMRRVFVAAQPLFPQDAFSDGRLRDWRDLTEFGDVWEAGMQLMDELKAQIPGGWPMSREPYDPRTPPIE